MVSAFACHGYPLAARWSKVRKLAPVVQLEEGQPRVRLQRVRRLLPVAGVNREHEGRAELVGRCRGLFA